MYPPQNVYEQNNRSRFFLLLFNSILHSVWLKKYWQKKTVSEIKPCQSLHFLGKIQKIRPPEELNLALTNKKIICLKASRERCSFKILPIDDARACRPIGLDRRQLGLVREKIANCWPWIYGRKDSHLRKTRKCLRMVFQF